MTNDEQGTANHPGTLPPYFIRHSSFVIRHSSFPNKLHLGLQLDALAVADDLLRVADEGEEIGGFRPAGIDDEVGVQRRYLRAADLVALQAGLLDQQPGVGAGRILEDRPGAGLARL